MRAAGMESEPLVDAPASGGGRGARTLRWTNLGLAAFQLGTGLAMCLLADLDKAVPLYTNFSHVAAGERTIANLWPVPDRVGKVSVGLLSGIFILLSFLDHLAVATVLHGAYNARLARGYNPFRWIEYAVSAPLMHVEIALLCGIYDVHTLFAIFGLTSVTMVFGYLGETAARADRVRVFWLGCVPHLCNWFIILCHFFRAVSRADPPDFVWSIIFVIFALDATFGVVALLRARGRRVCCVDFGKCVHVERCYMALSILAKQSLAWMQYWGIEGMRKE